MEVQEHRQRYKNTDGSTGRSSSRHEDRYRKEQKIRAGRERERSGGGSETERHE